MSSGGWFLAQDPVGEVGGQERASDSRRILYFGFAPGAMSSRMLVLRRGSARLWQTPKRLTMRGIRVRRSGE